MDRGNNTDIQRGIQAGAAAWMRAEGVTWDRKLKKQLTGRVLKRAL